MPSVNSHISFAAMVDLAEVDMADRVKATTYPEPFLTQVRVSDTAECVESVFREFVRKVSPLASKLRPDNSPPSRDFIRPTKRYAVHYTHNGETFNESIRAYDFDDAESRCRALNLVLDGEIG